MARLLAALNIGLFVERTLVGRAWVLSGCVSELSQIMPFMLTYFVTMTVFMRQTTQNKVVARAYRSAFHDPLAGQWEPPLKSAPPSRKGPVYSY